MLAIRVNAYGAPSVLSAEDIPVPTATPGHAIVKIAAAGVNFIDVYHRTGAYTHTLPFTIGQEAAGTVTAVGDDVTAVRIGDRVAYQGVVGAYAEYASVPVDRLVPLPDSVSFEQGAAVLLQGVTAHYLATSTFPLSASDTCIIHAAAGGVGLLLCQIAKMRGARVIGTVSTEAKARLAREAGADEIINYTTREFDVEARRLTNDRGVQVVYDSVGIATFDRSLNALAPRGMMVLYGQSSGAVPPFSPQILNQKGSLYLTRPSIGHYTATREELLQRTSDLFHWITTGKLHVTVGHTYSLAQAAEAHRALESRMTTGKLLLIV